MTRSFVELGGEPSSRLLLIADHASSSVPPGLDLGVGEEVMDEHVAVDIGVAPLAHALSASLNCPAILGGLSRLVIDLNREEDAPGLIPEMSDGRVIPGNAGLTADQRAHRIARYWRPYHDHISNIIAAKTPNLLISLHSFTPRLNSDTADRPWQIGILYNRDDRAARLALPFLEAAGVTVGDNLPYSGKVLNATMNRHGEANGIPYLGIEVRQDLISDGAGVAHWCATLVSTIRMVAAGIAAHG